LIPSLGYGVGPGTPSHPARGLLAAADPDRVAGRPDTTPDDYYDGVAEKVIKAVVDEVLKADPGSVAVADAPGPAADGATVTVEARRSDIIRLAPGDLAGASLIVASALLDMLTADGLAGKIDVKETHRFTDFDAYKKVLASGVDVVLLCTPPHFRPAGPARRRRHGQAGHSRRN